MIWMIFAAVLVVIGVAGTLLPALPGLPLVFLGLLIAAWADGFAHVGTGWLLLLGFITALGMAADIAASMMGTKMAGASKWAIWGTGIGTIVGLFFGLVGILIGPFLGAVAGEYLYREQLGQAAKAGLGAWLGLVLAIACRLAALSMMLGVFAFAWFVV